MGCESPTCLDGPLPAKVFLDGYVSWALTASLTSLPSTLAPASRAMAAFMTLPKSFAPAAPVSAMAAVTAAAMASGLADGGR